ncbi:type I pantothenate kinase [Ruminobacter sp. RM87]|uniref:type I pantothenate kinase n=1 Tax=Ruminobacter sp. RM87 TaxID=1200567 RepID=UPI0006908D48|nr:type I pantothenate kinase [Ruminobacter sp. RM87]
MNKSKHNYETLYSSPESEEIILTKNMLINCYGIEPVADAVIDSLLRKNNSALTEPNPKIIIGISGSVSVGKSTFSDLLLLSLNRRYPQLNKQVVSTDNFIYPTRILKERNLLSQKGFPVSYDYPKLIQFIEDFKHGKNNIAYPLYSHKLYDISDSPQFLTDCNILMLEGINVLSDSFIPENSPVTANVRDFLDISLFIEASENDLFYWYKNRFMSLIEDAKTNPEESAFKKMIHMTQDELNNLMHSLWKNINYKNFIQYIQPSMIHADLIVNKARNHSVTSIIRKLP